MSIVLRPPDTAEVLPGLGGPWRVLVSGEDTGGQLAIIEYEVAPGAIGATPHVHHAHREECILLEGELVFDTVHGARSIAAGGSVAVPKGEPHGFRNIRAAPARCLFVLTPALYEGYFREVSAMVAAGQRPGPVELADLRARYATEPAYR